MSNSVLIESLQQQLRAAKQEIYNLRQKLQGLKSMHCQDISKIKEVLSKVRQPPELIDEAYQLKPIGVINSQFPRIRGTPRQPSVTKTETATLTLSKENFTNPEHALIDLQSFSHLWIIFVFHNIDKKNVKAKVAPPRLNGKKTGVFASRAPHRPCPIGLSLVKIDKVVDNVVHFCGVDMVDGTPVLDIKPYIPHYDMPEDDDVIVPEWIGNAPVSKLDVAFTEDAMEDLRRLDDKLAQERRQLITTILQEDPRSVYLREKSEQSLYEFRAFDLLIACIFDNATSSVCVKTICKNDPNS